MIGHEQARENARQADGRFGTQVKDEAPLDLTDEQADPPSPLDDCDWIAWRNVRPGDRIARNLAATTGVGFVECTVMGAPRPAVDRFGRPMEVIACMRHDTGETDDVMFGPEGHVRRFRFAPAVAGAAEAWESVRAVTPDAPVTVLAGPDGDIRVTISGTQQFHQPAYGKVDARDKPGVRLRDIDDRSKPARPDVSGSYRVVGSGIDREFPYAPGDISEARWDAAEFIAALGRTD